MNPINEQTRILPLTWPKRCSNELSNSRSVTISGVQQAGHQYPLIDFHLAQPQARKLTTHCPVTASE